MNSRRPSIRLAAAAAGLTMLGLSLSGCTYLNPTQTHHFYQPAEGAVANFEVDGPDRPVGVRNIVIVEKDSKGKLIGGFSNHTKKEQTFDVTVIDKGTTIGSTRITVPAGETTLLGSENGEAPLELPHMTSKAGDNAVVRINVAGHSKELNVQILDDSLEYLGNK